MAPKKDMEKVYSRPTAEVFAAAREALASIGGSVKEEDSAQGTIAGNVSPSIWSWGEAVQIAIKSSGDGASSVTVESKSRVPITMADWGKNGKNVKRIIEHLDQKLA